MNKFLKSTVETLHCNVSTALILLMLCCFQPSFATPTTPTTDFIDNGDGTVTHKTTGLVWMRCSMGQTWDKATSNCTGMAATYTYAQAMALKSSFAGKSDWRLPNITELQTIVEWKNVNPAINTIIFPNTPSQMASSSSPITGSSGHLWSVHLWSVHFASGTSDTGYMSGSFLVVRFVRGGQWKFGSFPFTTPTADFTDNKDGTVTHKRTGLMWQRCYVGQTWTGSTCSGTATDYTWHTAMTLNSTFAGYSDWRLPNPNELSGIVEYGTSRPAINTTLFSSGEYGDWWSSSLFVYDVQYAFCMSVNSGSMTICRRLHDTYPYKSNTFVKFVRGEKTFVFLPFDINTQSTLALDFATQYDAKSAKIVELKNTSAKAIRVNNVIVSDAGSYWVNLFFDDKTACRSTNYSQTTKTFVIPANNSCKIGVGFSPFDNANSGKAVTATITFKTVIKGVATDKVIKVNGIGRAQVSNFYNTHSILWGQDTWGMAELKGGNPPINTQLVGTKYQYGNARFWYGGVIDATLQKTTASVGNVVVFAANSASPSGHVGVVIQTKPVVTMLSMNDVADNNGVRVRKWSVHPVDEYPNKTASWSPLITGFNTTDATKHYGFINWSSDFY